jgi:competence protein ComEC
MVISSVLLLYMLFLDTPPSLLRAFVMLMIGFTLYERGFEIISMQTLFLTIIFILAFFPRLFFSIGFWLSISGVFYIFLFFIHFKHISKTMQFLIIPFWVYIFMLPFSIAIFGNFSIYHPLSIITTILFTLFYPLSIVFHTVGFCDLFDKAIKYLITLKVHDTKLDIGVQILTPYIFLSFVSVFKKSFLYLTLLFAVFLLIYAMKHIA